MSIADEGDVPEDGKRRCPDCDAPMEAGFLPELMHSNMTGLTVWMAGTPEKKRLLGFETGTVKVRWDQVLPVTTYRCPRCGLLKSYAPAPPERT